MAPQGWAEFLAWMQQQSAAGTLDTEVAWGHFRGLAATSEHPGLAELIVRFQAAPARDRVALVATIAGMLAPIEWPVAWHAPRKRLVVALDELVRATNDHTAGSLQRILDLPQAIHLYGAGWADLAIAHAMLRRPCRRDEVQQVADLVNLGNLACRTAYRAALPRLDADDRSVARARHRYALAFAAYAEAARSMNDACGVVLFTGLDLHPDDEGET